MEAEGALHSTARRSAPTKPPSPVVMVLKTLAGEYAPISPKVPTLPT